MDRLRLYEHNNNDRFPLLQHSLSLHSAAGYPTYSNFTVDFQDLLDYIYVSSDLFAGPESISPLPLPSYDILTENTAIPSECFPSDHLPIAVDVHFKS
jgi:mRNA deadenylase 3'-5' endonuclease subunit Ccr4